MHPKTLLAAAGLASLGVAAASTPVSTHDPETSRLVERTEQANDALMRGDVDRYRALIPVANDFTLMAPVGGEPTRGGDEQARDAMRRFFRNGSLRQELVQAYRTPDMIVLAVIEHAKGEVGGLPLQDWKLRVTLVYRREGKQWTLVHRHADPLVAGIGLDAAAALGRGALR